MRGKKLTTQGALYFFSSLHIIFLVFGLFLTIVIRSQTVNDFSGIISKLDESNFELSISPTVYNIQDSTSIKIVELLEKYFATRAYISMSYLPSDENFWTVDMRKNYKMPDYLLRSTLFPFKNQKILPNLISIEKEDYKNYWIAKVAFNLFENANYKGLVCVYNYGVKNEDHQFKLFNLFDFANLNLIKKEGSEFYVDDESNKDSAEINKMIIFNNKMHEFFEFKKTFKYINVSDSKKINNLLGFDFAMYMYIPSKNSAFSDLANGIIYSSNNSFYNPHELVHLYVNEMYAGTCHSWFNEGLSTYWGGSMGLSLAEHLKKMKLFLSNNQTINLNNLLTYVRIDDITSYKYAIGGLLCKVVYEKYGRIGVLKLLEWGRSDEDFYKCIEIVLGIKKENLNEFIRKELEKY